MPNSQEWDLSNIPPPDKPKEVGPFVYKLFREAWQDRERNNIHDRWRENYRIYRGDHWNKDSADHDKITMNLAFANVVRTVAQLVSRDPHSEVKSIDSSRDGLDEALNQKLRNDWLAVNDIKKLARFASKMEIYGTGIAKHCWNTKEFKPFMVPKDNFAIFPAPGRWEDVATDAPYIIDVYSDYVTNIERRFGVKGVNPDSNLGYLGEDRKEMKPKASAYTASPSYYTANDYSVQSQSAYSKSPHNRALVIECWIRDYTMESIEVDAGTEEVWHEPLTGEPLDMPITMPKTKMVSRLKYPGGIRRITITNSGNLVLSDVPNPSVNSGHSRAVQEKSYGCWRFPYYFAPSYEDDQSIWGFSNIEQTADLIFKMDEIYSKAIRYIELKTMPILILPMDCGIDTSEITNEPGLILEPVNTSASQGIRYLEAPNVPADLMGFFRDLAAQMDRIHSIEEIDRGGAPGRVESASAIAMLQEKNSILLKHKIRNIDGLVREHGKWAISYYQNFHYIREPLEVNDQTIFFEGTMLAGRQFSYIVDASSTVHKTEFQERQDAKELFGIGAIDLEGLLKTLDVPNWRELLSRMKQNQIMGALSALVENEELAPEDAERIQQIIQGGEAQMQANMRPSSGGQAPAPAAGDAGRPA